MIRSLSTLTFSALIGALFLGALCLIAGESPVRVVEIVIQNSMLNQEDLAVTLFYSTHLMFAATGLCLAMHAGLFPIGAEGQISISCLATTVVGLLMGPSPFGIFLALLAGPLTAAGLGAVTAYFKVKKSSHEVIVTMMLNFLSASVANYLVSHFFQSSESQNPETGTLAPAFKLFSPLFSLANTPANSSFYLAIAVCFLGWFVLSRTRWGYEIRAVGLNHSVAAHSGISRARVITTVLIVSAALAGLSSFNQILGYNLKYQVGFSADYGFLAIVVALMASRNPLFVIPASFFFAILMKGSAELDIDTDTITRDFVKIIEGFLILAFVLAQKIDLKSLFSRKRIDDESSRA